MTRVEIRGEDFWVDGAPTYSGRWWRGLRIEGLLLNARMVQATFDDLNPETRSRWAYPDIGRWDAERNVREFTAMLPEYRQHGLLAITVNFRAAAPRGTHAISPGKIRGSAAMVRCDRHMPIVCGELLRRLIAAGWWSSSATFIKARMSGYVMSRP
jgi:hypothetical protein